MDEHVAPQSHADSGHRNHFAATGAPSGHRAQGCWVRQIDAGDLDDGLPRGFLAGAIVKVWVAHRLNWAGELLGRRGEELPRDVDSEPPMPGGRRRGRILLFVLVAPPRAPARPYLCITRALREARCPRLPGSFLAPGDRGRVSPTASPVTVERYFIRCPRCQRRLPKEGGGEVRYRCRHCGVVWRLGYGFTGEGGAGERGDASVHRYDESGPPALARS